MAVGDAEQEAGFGGYLGGGVGITIGVGGGLALGGGFALEEALVVVDLEAVVAALQEPFGLGLLIEPPGEFVIEARVGFDGVARAGKADEAAFGSEELVFEFAGADVRKAVAFELVAVLIKTPVAVGVELTGLAVVDEAATGGRGAESAGGAAVVAREA